jgi:hypothetical protein
MSRRTVVAALAGTMLLAGLSAPAMAGPAASSDEDETVICLRTDSTSGKRDGICVWAPIGIPPILP